MRNAARLVVLVGTMLVPVAAPAKKPPHVQCPPDVAAAVTEACPCAGKNGGTVAWKNHGEYVRCVAHARNSLRKGHCLDDAAKHGMMSCAGRSSCGKDGAVVCCPVAPGTCSDSTPDGDDEKTCANDPTTSCERDGECSTRRGHVMHDEKTCSDRGGVSDGPGSVCASACSPSGAFVDAAGF